MSGGFSKSKSMVTFRLHPNCFVKLFYRIWSSHSRKSRNSISRALAIWVLLGAVYAPFTTFSSYKLHYYLVMVFRNLVSNFLIFKWISTTITYACVSISPFIFLLALKFYCPYALSRSEYKHIKPQKYGTESLWRQRIVYGWRKKKICDVLLPKITIKLKKRKSEGKTSIQTEKVMRNAVSKKISA